MTWSRRPAEGGSDGTAATLAGTGPRPDAVRVRAAGVSPAAALPGVWRLGAVITLPFTVLNFISGVYVPFGVVPRWMQDVGAFFPLKWMAQGMRSVFLPEQAARLEPAHVWEYGRTALALVAWTAAGLVLCAKTLRWQSRS